jgi:hypothetical protein
MKPAIFILVTAFFVVFNRLDASAKENIKLHPAYVKCEDQLSIGLSGLDTTQQYKISVDCGNLSCSGNFAPREHTILGKKATTITEDFSLESGCTSTTSESTATFTDEPQPGIAAGKYVVNLYSATNTILASANFWLVPPTGKVCEIKARNIGYINEDHLFEINTSQACIFTASLVSPSNIRKPILNHFIEANKPKVFSIKGADLSEEGIYHLTAIASPECNADLDRECKGIQISIKGKQQVKETQDMCAYANNKDANCYQCGSGYICGQSNLCVKDTMNKCISIFDSALETTTSIMKGKEPPMGLINEYNWQAMLLVGIASSAILGSSVLLLFRVFGYKIKKDDKTFNS